MKHLKIILAVIISITAIAGAIYGFGKRSGVEEEHQKAVIKKVDMILDNLQGHNTHLQSIDSSLEFLKEQGNNAATRNDIDQIRHNQMLLFKYNTQALQELEKIRKEKELENILKKNLSSSQIL